MQMLWTFPHALIWLDMSKMCPTANANRSLHWRLRPTRWSQRSFDHEDYRGWWWITWTSTAGKSFINHTFYLNHKIPSNFQLRLISQTPQRFWGLGERALRKLPSGHFQSDFCMPGRCFRWRSWDNNEKKTNNLCLRSYWNYVFYLGVLIRLQD